MDKETQNLELTGKQTSTKSVTSLSKMKEVRTDTIMASPYERNNAREIIYQEPMQFTSKISFEEPIFKNNGIF